MTDAPHKGLLPDHLVEMMEKQGIKVFRDVKVNLEWYDDPKRIHLIGMQQPRRPGVLLFFTMLEYVYFTPSLVRGGNNDQFIMAYFEWTDAIWAVISIPVGYRSNAEDTAEKCGVRLADGVPTSLEWDKSGKVKPQYFPVKGDNAYNLENVQDHPVYRNLFGMTDEWFKIEDEYIQQFHQGQNPEFIKEQEMKL